MLGLMLAATVAELFVATKDASDARTNIAAASSEFPSTASATALELDAALLADVAGLAAKANALKFVAASAPREAVVRAERAIESWQDAFFGSDDEDLEEVWPDLDAEATLELKLAIERGADRLTLHHIVLNDLESPAAREALYARLAKKGAELRKARGGKPALTIVNTDVDDTLIPNLWDRGRYAAGVTYPGVRELLGAQGDFLVVLTARPAIRNFVSGRTRSKIVAMMGLATTDPLKVNLSVAPGEALEILDTLEMGLVKAEALLAQRRLFPEADSVFNGDSGQGDWIAALILRDLHPETFPYATIHDVRPWSRKHRDLIRGELYTSERLEEIYRVHHGIGPRPSVKEDAVLDKALNRVRETIVRAMDGPEGRLDAGYLRSRGVFLFRNHAALALELADEGRIAREAARVVVGAAAKGLRFLPANDFGFDAGERERLQERIRAEVTR